MSQTSEDLVVRIREVVKMGHKINASREIVMKYIEEEILTEETEDRGHPGIEFDVVEDHGPSMGLRVHARCRQCGRDDYVIVGHE